MKVIFLILAATILEAPFNPSIEGASPSGPMAYDFAPSKCEICELSRARRVHGLRQIVLLAVGRPSIGKSPDIFAFTQIRFSAVAERRLELTVYASLAVLVFAIHETLCDASTAAGFAYDCQLLDAGELAAH
jgi:hypothetical protein